MATTVPIAILANEAQRDLASSTQSMISWVKALPANLLDCLPVTWQPIKIKFSEVQKRSEKHGKLKP